MKQKFFSLSDRAFGGLFEAFKHSAFRLETLQSYDVSYEEKDFARFLAGRERSEPPGIASWVDIVRRGRDAGKLFHRVHVVTEPLTDYVRFECAWSYRDTVTAGEDVRIISTTSNSWPVSVPHVDYWLFDSSIIASMVYSEEGCFDYGFISDESADLADAIKWRDAALKLSIPFSSFDARFDELMHERLCDDS